MNNFEYQNPVKIVFGKGQIAKIKELIPADANILITCGGGSIKQNGVYNQVVAALEGFKFQEFWGIEPNPKYETLMKAVEIVRNENITFLLSVGGGSVLDGTKFIANASLAPKGEEWNILKGKYIPTNGVALASVLTLPATGSEMNAGAVITRLETKEKLAFHSLFSYPKFSVLDPETTFSLSQTQRANGVVDAFVHVIEQYLTYPVNSPIQDRFAESILRTLIDEANVYCSDNEYNTAANVMWASTVALNGLIAVGVVTDWATHVIGHEITMLHGVDHGRTLAIILPSLLKVQKEQKREKLIGFAKHVWHICEGSEDEKIAQAIDKTENFFRSLGVMTKLSEYNIPQTTINEITTRLNDRGWRALGERKDITPAKIEEILTLAF
jgi:NADP-dependent alcohol dehydrogenase